MNVFTWIREGVRQAVLLGVSDAIETIGAPSEENDIRPRLQEALRMNADLVAPAVKSRSRKKLGRTLSET